MPPNGSLFPSEEELRGILVGPESLTWRYGSDARLYLVMLYPLLLQVAHPTVGAGVKDFSDFESRPWNRLLRTLDYVSLLVYGGLEAAAVGRRLRAIHKGFRGTKPDGERYYALEPEAYAWVHATLLDSYVAGHRRFGTPMSRPEVERFYLEYKGLGRLVGVREGDLPGDWNGFREYFDRVSSEVLERTDSVDRVMRSIEHAAPPIPSLPAPLWHAMRQPAKRALYLGGVGLLTPALRERFGLRWTRADETAFQAIAAISRRMTPLMPKALRIMGPGQLRMRRRAIAHGPLGPGAGAPRAQAA